MFKDRLKELRLEKGLTQAAVAKAIGVSSATIGNYEQGTREPKNNILWQSLADFFGVSVDYLMDKNITESFSSIKKEFTLEDAKKNRFKQFREDVPIIYNGQDISCFVFSKPGDTLSMTKKQQHAYFEFLSRSGHVRYARANLLYIIEDIKSSSKEVISSQLKEFEERIESNVVYWFKRCWSNLDSEIPAVTSLETLFDLIEKCILIDMVGELEFSLLPLKTDSDILREKLR